MAIQESWNPFDKEYCFKLVKSMPEKIKSSSTKEDFLQQFWKTGITFIENIALN